MEVETIAGEVKYSLKIPNLSSYNEEKELYSEFSLSLGGLRSRWRVSIQPFLSAKPNKPHPINSDIGITISCVRSSITRPNIDIYCSVLGRGEEHEKKLELVGEDGSEAPPTWQGVLVPRLALHVFDLLPHDQLTAILRFVVRTDDIWRNVDPLEELSVHLRKLREGKFSDVNILTSDGVTIPAHSVILHARSSLLWEASHETDITEDHATPTTKDYLDGAQNRPETPFNSVFGSDMSSSGYNSSVNSTGRSASVSSPSGRSGSSMTADRVTSASSATRVSSPRHPRTPSNLTGDKRPYSSSKHSPNKRGAPRVTQNSPSRRILHWENKTPRWQSSPLPPVCCDSVNSSTSCSPFSKSPLKEMEVNIQRSLAEDHTIKVNMSASVTESMLDWIYTGKYKMKLTQNRVVHSMIYCVYFRCYSVGRPLFF